MKQWRILVMMFGLLALASLFGCAGIRPVNEQPQWPEGRARELVESGRYYEAMRALPGEMEEWEQYTEQTGNTGEGAAGFIYSVTLDRIAVLGDHEWGKILDDPQIPHRYKTQMIMEILERRLGRGSAWSPNDDLILVPENRKLKSWDEVNELLHRALERER